MEKVWLRSYPSGVPAEIDPSQYSSVNDLRARACAKFGRRAAFRNLGAEISFFQLDRMTRDFAAWLQSVPGLEKGSRVALMMPNILQYPVALFGVLRAGMVVVNVNPLYTPRELEHQLRDSGAEVIVIVENFAHVLQAALPNTAVRRVVTTQIADIHPAPRRWAINFVVKRIRKMVPEWRIPGALSFRRALRLGQGLPCQEATLTHDDTAFLQYTGGTTGTSKGAILTHRNMIANLLQAGAWAETALKMGEEVVVTAIPMYHVFALTVNCLLFTHLGGTNLLITNPRDLPEFVKELKNSRFSIMTGVNTLFNALLNTPGFEAVDFSNLKFCIGAGAAVQRMVAERWKAVTGRALLEGYGLTETSPLVTCNPLDSEYTGFIGLPASSTEISIRDDQDCELPYGAEGEICVRGPQVMRGYWNQPEETRRVMTAAGWLRTGDIGLMNEHGYVRITDRKKDMILVSGFNVYPSEVEDVIASVPGVFECAVVGVPDTVTTEAVKAFVVRKDPELTADTVIAFCRRSLTKYKVPKQIEFRNELPKNNIGKVLRRELRTAGRAERRPASAA